MIKRTPSRNHRSKGIKLKHVLQIILLLGVCFWLIYQIKHSHDKKKEFDENDAKASARMQTADQILKLGRKDPLPHKDDVIQTEQQDEKEEDENTLEDEGNMHEHDEQEEEVSKHETGENIDEHEFREQDEEEGKHGPEEQEEEENKREESEDDGRGGGGDEEIEENDQEKPEVDIDHDEEFVGDEKEKEKEESDEKENEDGEDEEKDGSVEDKNTHEAREEHYKADDASSAVAHDTQTTSTESLILSSENSNENSEMNIVKQENRPNYTEESDTIQNDSGKITENELKGGNVLIATGKESGNTILSNSVDSSNINTTTAANSDGHLEASSNHSAVISGAINDSTGDGINTLSSSEQNEMAITSNSGVKNEKTEELKQSDRVREDNLPNINSTGSVTTENEDAAAGESSNSGAGELNRTVSQDASNETQNNSNTKENIDASVDEKSKVHNEMAEANVTQKSSDAKENNVASMDEKSKDDTPMDSTDRTSDSSSVNGGVSDVVEQDAIDASDTHVHVDVTEVRTDLDTLPNIINEGNILDENAAE